MNKHAKQKRLDKIQAALRRSSNAGDTIMVYELYDVPDFDHAVKRARDAEANHVVFVPLRGAVRGVDAVPSRANRAHAVAVAYQGTNPTDDQLRRLLKWGARDGEGAEKIIAVSGQPLQGGTKNRRRVTMSFQRAGKEFFRLSYNPSELP